MSQPACTLAEMKRGEEHSSFVPTEELGKYTCLSRLLTHEQNKKRNTWKLHDGILYLNECSLCSLNTVLCGRSWSVLVWGCSVADSHTRAAELSSGGFLRRRYLLFISLTGWVDYSFLNTQNVDAGLPTLGCFVLCSSSSQESGLVFLNLKMNTSVLWLCRKTWKCEAKWLENRINSKCNHL